VHAKIAAASVLCALAVSAHIAAPAVADVQSASASPPQVTLSLHDAVQLALSNNLTYQSALVDERTAEAQVVQARSAFQPKVSAGYSYFHTQNEGAFVFPAPSPSGPPKLQTVVVSAKDLNNVNATLQYALYTGGAAEAAIGQAAANLAATQSQLAGLRATVIADTTRSYFSLIEAQQSAHVADQAASVAAQDLKTASELFKAGTAAKVDVLRSNVTLADAQVNAIKAHNNASLANARLANELNINLGAIISPSESLQSQAPAFTLDSLLDSARARPELAAANDAVIIADHAVRGARAAYLPSVDLQVQEASSKPNFVNVPQPQLSETLAVTWQLFSGGLTRGKVLQALAQVDKAKINLKAINNNVDLEVREAYFNYTAAQAQVGASLQATESAGESLRVNQIRYRSGVGTSLELSDALLSNTQAQNQYISALADLRVSLVAVQRAAGLLPPTGL